MGGRKVLSAVVVVVVFGEQKGFLMINDHHQSTELINWKTLTPSEKNRLLHEEALGLSLPGTNAQRWLQGLQRMGLPMSENTRRIVENDSPLNHIPNYVGEKARAMHAVHEFFARTDIETLIASTHDGVSAEEAKRQLLSDCELLDADAIGVPTFFPSKTLSKQEKNSDN